jgi:hypothetical protein
VFDFILSILKYPVNAPFVFLSAFIGVHLRLTAVSPLF